MYLKHYKLKVKPFDLSPRPDLLWLGEKHKEALSVLEYGIHHNMGFVLLTGEVGVGKTALIRRLISSLDAQTLVAHITDPDLDNSDFFKILADHFNLERNFVSKGEFLIAFEKFLRQTHAANKKVLLIVDEAQRLNNVLLDQIRVLSNIELDDRKLISIFLVGQPELKKILFDDLNRAFRQRIAINYNIETLSESETAQYIEHRLAMAGATDQIFQPDAIRQIHRYSQGHPRLINIICDYALLTGYSAGVETIDAALITECKQDLAIDSPFGINVAEPPPAAGPAGNTASAAGSFLSTESPPPKSRSSTLRAYFVFIAFIAIMLVGVATYYGLRPDHVEQLPPMPQTANRQIAQAPAQTNDNRAATNGLEPEFALRLYPILPEPAKEPQVAEQPVLSLEPIAPVPDTAPMRPDSDRTVVVAEPTSLKPQSDTDTGSADPPAMAHTGPRKEPQKDDGAPPVETRAPATDPGTAVSAQRVPGLTTPTPSPSAPPEAQPRAQAPPQPPARPESNRPTTPTAQVAQAKLAPTPAPQQPQRSAPSGSQAANLDLQQRLSAFLQRYCATYEAKDLDAFGKFFAPDAMENDQPFKSLLPKYERNFTFIETIEYQIELQRFAYDVEQQMVSIEGTFSLKWLPPDKRWRENGGTIAMRLAEEGSSFVVHRLEYHGGQPPNESASGR
jgi:general secretion pathway protein A